MQTKKAAWISCLSISFKQVNDTYGHAAGDEVLEQVSRLFEDELPNGLITRQGGDEFAYLQLGVMSDQELEECIERLQSRVSNTFAHLQVGLGCSVVSARTDCLTQNPDSVLHIADKDMYREKALHHAKESSRNNLN